MKSQPDSGLRPGLLATFRAHLLTARHRLLEQLGEVQDGLKATGELGASEIEEQSQIQAATDLSLQLGEEEFFQLCRIEGAMQRIAFGRFGSCTRCGNPIAIGRLRADPSAAFCTECAGAMESGQEPLPTAETAAQAADAKMALPPDLVALDDAEIAALVEERFHEEVGEALGDVRVVCRRGVVLLAGEVASHELRQVALQIVEDEMGLDAVDRLRVSLVGAEMDGLWSGSIGPDFEEGELALDLSDGGGASDDIFTVQEEGLAYTPPERPVAEGD